jgi:hypothetical protein
MVAGVAPVVPTVTNPFVCPTEKFPIGLDVPTPTRPPLSASVVVPRDTRFVVVAVPETMSCDVDAVPVLVKVVL